jgi:hypothetical protein
LRSALVQLLDTIRDDNVEADQSGFKLLSSLFVLVEGELSRLRLFAKEPPFYRRLASFAHASLIYRQIAGYRVDGKTFSDWAWNNCGEAFYMQSLADMRLEPRWQPDFATPFQLKADFLGRIMNAVRGANADGVDDDLRAMVLGDSPTSLQSLGGFPYPYLPGPLEGSDDVPTVMPAELSEVMESQLKAERPSFVALVNAALIFRVAEDKAALAAKAIQLCQYRFSDLRDTSQLLNLVNGLATVAAVTRSHELADQVRILVRRYQHDRASPVQSAEAMRVCLVAAASRAEPRDWSRFVGEWLTELAFRISTQQDGQAVHSHLLSLLRAAPELWVSCGRADAALRALCAL